MLFLYLYHFWGAGDDEYIQWLSFTQKTFGYVHISETLVATTSMIQPYFLIVSRKRLEIL
jgi:hypothetical protein